MKTTCLFALGLGILLGTSVTAAAAPSNAAEAEQLRIVNAMSELLRARVDKLPVLIPAGHPVGDIKDVIVTLNRDAVTVEGQRFDGVVVTAPETKAAFAWAFAAPENSASWYILREKGDMKGFANFLRQSRSQVPLAATMKPQKVEQVTFQTLSSAAWSPNERYIIWFRFTNDQPVELSLRAAFLQRASVTNNALPALLFPNGSK